ncbi:protein MCM10 homolog [Dioscorea cayenensis subsp. rotundata]|uniref:Protein MCM10 homolog n=1 Tax=Dioscorea cayennensis subsp. rotundata TaxID=55577 RepID=A0AB40BHT5_DIOCR|nr:protein MCM10 homolog [Dioscorea cayenensis subsp. rotundata]
MASNGDDLDLLLSLREDRVPETPPGSPSSHPSDLPGYFSDDALPKRTGSANMSVFRDAVKDYLDEANPSTSGPVVRNPKKARKSHEVEAEKFSDLRIRNSLISSVELSNRLSDLRFVRLTAIRNLLSGDTLSGCWATIGVLTEKGAPKLSSAGKNYCIWKMGCLDELNVSVFLFGDAYSRYSNEPLGSVFVLFNSVVRKDSMGSGFSLSIYSATQFLKIGTSADFGICKSKRQDGNACTMAINKHQGQYCKYHTTRAYQKYSTMRSEFKGGNLQRMFKLQSEGIYMVDPLASKSNLRTSTQRAKVLSVDGLKKALSNAENVTSNRYSQGIRFLSKVTANTQPKVVSRESAKDNHLNSKKRPTSSMVKEKIQLNAKRNKTTHSSSTGNMIELDIVNSDEEC